MTTYFQTLLHLLKGTVAAGVFSMGVAFKNGGMIVALIGTPVMGLLVLHCITILMKVMDAKSSEKKSNVKVEEKKSYADIVEEVFLDGPPITKFLSRYMRTIINFEICFSHIGYTCVFVVFVGNNVAKVFHSFDFDLPVSLVMLIFIIPMWLSALITNLKLLAPVSALANVILMGALVITLYFLCDDLPPFDTVKYVGGINSIPLFLTVALYSYDTAPLVAGLRNEMDKPQRMIGAFGVLNVGFFIVIPIVTLVGFLSYLKYGDGIEGTVFLNFPERENLARALIILVCIQVLFTYPVILYVPVTTIWPMIEKRYGPLQRPLLSLLCFRTALVMLTLIISEAIPFIDLVISLIGAVTSTCLTLIIPALVDIVYFFGKEESTLKRTYLVMKNSLIIALALVIFSTGLFISISDIVKSF